MADHTHIEWTDATWNPITGCSVVSAGCKHCYAMKLAGTRLQHHPSRAGLTTDTKAGPVWNGQVRFNERWLPQPLAWRRPRRIFVCAHGDLFHENVPDQWIDEVFAIMSAAPQHTFQVLTKRPRRMQAYCADPGTLGRVLAVLARWGGKVTQLKHVEDGHNGIVLPNVWLGVSIEDQAAADERIPLLLATPAAVRWVSAEPLLGPVDLRWFLAKNVWEGGVPVRGRDYGHGTKLDWVVAGGESGTGARPMSPDWARSLRDQCKAADVAFLFKQWGSWLPVEATEDECFAEDGTGRQLEGTITVTVDRGQQFARVGKKAAGRLLDGVLHDEYPEKPHGRD